MQLYGHTLLATGPHVSGAMLSPVQFGGVHGLGFDLNLSPQQLILRGKSDFVSLFEQSDFNWNMFLNGVLDTNQNHADSFQIGSMDGASVFTAFIVGLLNSTGNYNSLSYADDVRLSWPVGSNLSQTTIFEAIPIGTKIILRWSDIPDESDFNGYVIYWDDGTGTIDFDTPLATVQEKQVTQYVVSGLDSGTYKFALLYTDVVGNVGNGTDLDGNGAFITVQLFSIPSPPEIECEIPSSFAIGESRIINVEIIPPDDTDDIAIYILATNQNPVWGELPFPETDLKHVYTRYIDEDLTIPVVLYPGNWKIQAFAVSNMGGYSVLNTQNVLEFSATENDGELVIFEGSMSGQIVGLVALSVAGGNIRVFKNNLNMESQFGLRFYRDGVFVGNVPHQSSRYEFTDTELVNGTEYTYTVKPYYEDGDGNLFEGTESAPVTAISDSSAPTGNQLLTYFTSV